jgi:hypothetical protein
MSDGGAGSGNAGDGLRVLPAGREPDQPWLSINELQLTFNQI